MCDCETPDASMNITRRARVTHQCCECGGTIQPGEQYQYFSGVWEGHGMSFKTCSKCVGARNYYVAECLPRGDCWPCFGSLWEDATDQGQACTVDDIILGATAAGYL